MGLGAVEDDLGDVTVAAYGDVVVGGLGHGAAGYSVGMTENAGTDPRVAAAEASAEPPDEETDATQRKEDPTAVDEEPERLYEA